jgi:trans-aconitate methyltransferase
MIQWLNGTLKIIGKVHPIREKWAKELMNLLELEGYENVLDIGCGDGRITAEIAAKIPEGRIWGIDNSIEMIKLAQRTFPLKNILI